MKTSTSLLLEVTKKTILNSKGLMQLFQRGLSNNPFQNRFHKMTQLRGHEQDFEKANASNKRRSLLTLTNVL